MHGIPITKELSLKFKELYLNGESTRSISIKFNRSHTSILRHLKLQCVKIRNKSSAAKLGVIKGRILIKRNKILKQKKYLNKNKSYILGTLCGDGWISYNLKKRRFQIGLNAIDKEFVEKFKDCLNKVYGIKRKIKKLPKRNINWNYQYLIRICSKFICKDILKYNNFKTKTWIIPKEIKNSSLKIQSQFIKGFFDSEGTVDKRSSRISTTSSNLSGLKELKDLLKKFNIRSSINTIIDKRGHPNKYLLNIQDRKSIEIYNKNIGFIIKRKQESLNQIVFNYKQYQRLTEDLEKFIPKIKELRNSGLSYEKICKELELPLTTVWNYSKK